MEKVKAFLDANSIEYRLVRLGDKNFNVFALQVSFYYDGIGNRREQRIALEKYVGRRKRTLSCRILPFGAGRTYEILPTSDAIAIDKYREEKDAEVHAFWKVEHERRLLEERR